MAACGSAIKLDYYDIIGTLDKKRGEKRGKLEEQLEKEVEVKQTNENGRKEVEEVAVEEVKAEEEKNEVEKQLLLKEVSIELVKEVRIDLERGTGELKDEETSLKEEQVEEPVPADPLGIRDESSDDSASQSELAGTWIEELLIDVETIFTARENMDKQNSLDAHCHSKGGAPVEVKERKEMEEMKVSEVMVQKDQERVREELKDEEMSLKEEQVEEPVQADPLDLLLNTVLANSLSKLEEKETTAISTHFKNSGDAQHQDYELLLMKLKRKWTRIFSEMNTVTMPLVHPPTSSLHNDTPVDLDLHLNTTVDSTLKEELKQMDMKRKWMKRLREREELKNLTDSSDERPADVSHTEKSVQSPPLHPPRTTPPNVHSPVKGHKQMKRHLNKTSTCSQEQGPAKLEDMEEAGEEKKRGKKRGKQEEQLKKEVEVKQTNENGRKEVEEVAVEEVKAEKEKNEVEKQLLLKEVSIELVKEVRIDLERGTGELKDEETSLKEEQVEEPVQADPLACKTTAACKASEQAIKETLLWSKDLLLNTVLANSLSKLEEKEATAISTHFKNSGDAQHQEYELLLMKLKRKWAGIFSETSAVKRPLVHPPTSSLHNDAPVDMHLHLNTTVDSTLKEELKQMDMKRKWMKRLREREELKNLTDSSDERPADVSHTEKSDLLLPTNPPINLSKLEDKEASAISSHLKKSGQAQYQDYELLLMKMKKKWAGIFSETRAVKRPLVHPPTSSLHNDTPVDLHLHLNTTVDSTLKKELKQMDMKRKWMKRLREREELKNLTDSSDERPADVSHTEKSDLLLPTNPPINLSKLEDKEASAISSHLKNSGQAQYQDYELLLMKMKRKWAGIFSETRAVKRPLVHPPTSSLHNDTPVDLHLHLNTTVDSTLKEELKQMDMKRKWMKRLREREELKNLTDSSDERPADVSHTEKSVQSLPLHPPRTTPPNVHSPVKGHKQMSWKRHLNKTSTCSQEQVHAKKAQRKRSKNLT
ncbi:uncharacterized protein LOC119265943 [Pygocentrus nattereri]|uniref:uncharacterized protein LOC119265943 n=1 Tax=Pygocentrus nattereri TaxID=42514 RepID=UPI00189148AB|nr:uncharacterized protein LOC119265943 [Pygocentrus nattereri]